MLDITLRSGEKINIKPKDFYSINTIDGLKVYFNFDPEHDERGRFATTGGDGGGGSITSAKMDELVGKYPPQSVRPGEQNQLAKAAFKEVGYDGKPNNVSTQEYDKLKSVGQYQEYYRGYSKNPQEYINQYKTGEYFVGSGQFGAGTYTFDNATSAAAYAKDGSSENVLKMLVPNDAKVANYDHLRPSFEKYKTDNAQRFDDKAKAATSEKERSAAIDMRYGYEKLDFGAYAASKGYQIVHHTPSETDARNIVVVLDRSATVVANTNKTNSMKRKVSFNYNPNHDDKGKFADGGGGDGKENSSALYSKVSANPKLGPMNDIEKANIQQALKYLSPNDVKNDVTVNTSRLGNKYGNTSGNRIYLDSDTVQKQDPLFTAAILKHEGVHTQQSYKMSSSTRETQARVQTRFWAYLKSGNKNATVKEKAVLKKVIIEQGG